MEHLDACHEILEVYSTLNILKEEETAALSPPSVTSPQASLFTSLHLKSQIERSSDIESKARTNGPRYSISDCKRCISMTSNTGHSQMEIRHLSLRSHGFDRMTRKLRNALKVKSICTVCG